MKLTIKNYRCFADSDPVTIGLEPGFAAFIGVNNSGKSSLLRFFFEFRALFSTLTTMQLLRDLAVGGTVSFGLPGSVPDGAALFCNLNSRDIVIQISEIDTSKGPDPGIAVNRIDLTIIRATPSVRATFFRTDGKLPESPNIGFQGHHLMIENEHVAEMSVFIETMNSLSRTMYVGAFRNILNVGVNESYYDIKTGQAVVEEWRNRKTGTNNAQAISAIKITEDIKEIFEFKSLEINPAASGVTLQVVSDAHPYMLPEVGSGIAQFIMVLANASVQQPDYILIDEPELNLHPSLQIDFLTTLGTYAKRGVLYSTHSLGLALSASDRVYSVRRTNAGHSEVREYDATVNLAEFCGELSYSGYKELGFDQILLVEGPTDVRTILQFLRRLRKAHQVVLLPLGGRSLINGKVEAQLQEILRITTKVATIIDSERTASGDPLSPERQDFVNVCATNGIACHVLDRRATENYLTDAAIKAVMGPAYQALGHFEKLSDSATPWTKQENWRIAAAMEFADISGTDLGAFLSSL